MNRSAFPIVSAVIINVIVLGALFLAIIFLNGFSDPAITKVESNLPTGYISTVMQTEQLHEANYQWRTKSNQRLVQHVKDINTFAIKRHGLVFKWGTKARFYEKQQGNELIEHTSTVFLINNGKKDVINLEKGTFIFPDKKGRFIFEANIEAE
jgi:hypothetical protein